MEIPHNDITEQIVAAGFEVHRLSVFHPCFIRG
jgi:hypothetical protein